MRCALGHAQRRREEAVLAHGRGVSPGSPSTPTRRSAGSSTTWSRPASSTTRIIFYCADNGASGEGSPNGSVNENKFFNGYPDDLTENMKYLDVLGRTGHLQPLSDRLGGGVHHAVPDVQALLAVRRRHMRSAGHPLAEGHQGQGRGAPPVSPFAPTSCPTILDVVGLEMPKVYRGVEQYPLNGVSMRYTFDDAEAPTTEEAPVLRDARHARHLGGRLEGGRAARADQRQGPLRPGPLGAVPRRRGPLRVEGPRRAEHPEKLQGADRRVVRGGRKELRAAARRSHRDRAAHASSVRRREPPRTRYIYYPDTTPVPEGVGGQHPRPFVQDHRRRRTGVRMHQA